MITNFKRRYEGNSIEETLAIGKIISEGNLTNFESRRLMQIKEAWNFYEGYHWEGIDDLDEPQVTFNYIRPFVNKFVAFEFGNGFSFKTMPALDGIPVAVNDPKWEANIDENENGVLDEDEKKITTSEKTLYEFVKEVWSDNQVDTLLTEIGQTKSITGDAWVKVQYFSPEDLDDPFEKYPNGRIRLTLIPTQFIFPTFNQHDRSEVESILIMYPIAKKETTGIFRRKDVETTVVYKEVWTKDKVEIYEGKEKIEEYDNTYNFLPFVQIKNFIIAGRSYGASDVEDLIPLNVEYNTKKSDVSEIIDYHSAPITLVYGAKIGNLEKGANKVWGGLPKDSRVENLNLQGDLPASVNYTHDIKTSMCEIGGIPETVLGGAQAISNTSGVALQYINLPLIERTRVKRLSSKTGFETINSMIILIALNEGLINKPEDISLKEFLRTEVAFNDTLPKDELIELQKIEAEMKMGLEGRVGALERLGRTNPIMKIAEVDKERQMHPDVFGIETNPEEETQLNSGMTNGNNAIEEVRKEVTGSNGMTSES